MGQSPGGFRTWWRQLHDGSDEHLDNAHLVRLAGRFSRRVRGWARKHGVPVVFCQSGERKHDEGLRTGLSARPELCFEVGSLTLWQAS